MFVYIDRRMVRVYVLGRRLHHGATGAAFCVLGAALMLHDRRDWRAWLRFTD